MKINTCIELINELCNDIDEINKIFSVLLEKYTDTIRYHLKDSKNRKELIDFLKMIRYRLDNQKSINGLFMEMIKYLNLDMINIYSAGRIKNNNYIENELEQLIP